MKIHENCPYQEKCDYSEEELIDYASKIQNPRHPLKLSFERVENMDECFAVCDSFRNQLFISLKNQRTKEGAAEADLRAIAETEESIKKTIEWMGNGIAY